MAVVSSVKLKMKQVYMTATSSVVTRKPSVPAVPQPYLQRKYSPEITRPTAMPHSCQVPRVGLSCSLLMSHISCSRGREMKHAGAGATDRPSVAERPRAATLNGPSGCAPKPLGEPKPNGQVATDRVVQRNGATAVCGIRPSSVSPFLRERGWGEVRPLIKRAASKRACAHNHATHQCQRVPTQATQAHPHIVDCFGDPAN